MILAWQFAVMLISTCIFFVWFLYKPIKPGLSRDDSNISINKQRQEELVADVNQGLIDDNQYQIAESEIINTLANELDDNNKGIIEIKPMNWSIASFLFLSVFSIAIYSQLSPKIPPNYQALIDPVSMNDSVKQLQIFLEENPDDFQALKLMGMAQTAIGNIDESIQAFESAYLINPLDIDLLLQYSSAIAASQEGQFDGKSKVLIDEAFNLNPQSIQVLYFSGIVAAHEGNFNDAINYWQKALYLMPENHPDKNIIEEALDTIMNLQVK
ncbi:MAG: c-type cytochrome biogenesis protein CcmI [Pseudomonadota bacterium]|nr:c-type cytochrome biogenesis protein CcmI [Pseudomonadota bacterium]